MFSSLILLTLLTSYAQSVIVSQQEWDDYKNLYNKRYKRLDRMHFNCYKQSKENLAKNKILYGIRLIPYLRKGCPERLIAMRTSRAPRPFLPSTRFPTIRSIDWRKRGVVSPVENQGNDCHSCWAFSAAGALESHLSIKYNTTVRLSVKNLLDCSGDQNNGCGGGFVSTAFKYIMAVGGIALIDSYAPYRPATDNCSSQSPKDGGTLIDFKTLPKDDERALEHAVYNYGPVTVSIHTTNYFLNYTGGVFCPKNCPNNRKSLNHSLLVVGFGTDPKDGDYWLLKNSLGVGWGEEGYMRLARNRNNMCGVASIGQYPIV